MIEGLLLTAWIGCQTLDTGTTYYALQRPHLYREVNPLLGSLPNRMLGVKVSFNVGMLIWREKRQATMSPLRVLLPLSMASAGCIPGVINYRTIRRHHADTNR